MRMETKVSALEVAKNFGQISDMALVQPVHVTKHGRKHIVMISEAEYQLLKSNKRLILDTQALPEEILEALLANGDIHPDAKLYNDEVKDWKW